MIESLTSRATSSTTTIHVVSKRGRRKWQAAQNKTIQNWLKATGFDGKDGEIALLPGRDGKLSAVAVGIGDLATPWSFAGLPRKLPAGRYAFGPTLAPADAASAALGWALGGYRFTRYKSPSRSRDATLVWPEGADVDDVTRQYEGIALGRDLITTPANDLGPGELVDAVRGLATQHSAKVSVIKGKALLDKGFPAIHAVGRAAAQPPQLADLRWGDEDAPKLTLVGKGVCFDSGGLDLKNAAGMRLMKKDMGGAATVLALAHMIMDAQLPVRLRVLVPAVENAVSGDAYRPGDIIDTRKGLKVEIGNTDAEGRVILGDALTEADSEDPDLIVDFATLTGAARVALGTELPALFCDDDDVATAVLDAGVALHDPLWRMPLYQPYRRHLDSPIADLNNISKVSTGGAITAALYLQAFVSPQRRWAHIDTMAYNSSSRPGRPEGGEIFAARAFFSALRTRYGA
jgi:leucyl aminopeptidase